MHTSAKLTGDWKKSEGRPFAAREGLDGAATAAGATAAGGREGLTAELVLGLLTTRGAASCASVRSTYHYDTIAVLASHAGSWNRIIMDILQV